MKKIYSLMFLVCFLFCACGEDSSKSANDSDSAVDGDVVVSDSDEVAEKTDDKTDSEVSDENNGEKSDEATGEVEDKSNDKTDNEISDENGTVVDADSEETDEEVTDSDIPELEPELIISEYVDGINKNKGLEFYNSTDAEIDLSEYKVCLVANDDTDCSADRTYEMSGKLAAHGIFTICDAHSNIPENKCSYRYPAKDTATGKELPAVTWFNGDDRIKLVKNGVVVDAFGKFSERPAKVLGEDGVNMVKPWEGVDLRRKAMKPYLGVENFAWNDHYTKHDKEDYSNFGLPTEGWPVGEDSGNGNSGSDDVIEGSVPGEIFNGDFEIWEEEKPKGWITKYGSQANNDAEGGQYALRLAYGGDLEGAQNILKSGRVDCGSKVPTAITFKMHSFESGAEVMVEIEGTELFYTHSDDENYLFTYDSSATLDSIYAFSPYSVDYVLHTVKLGEEIKELWKAGNSFALNFYSYYTGADIDSIKLVY